jgi:hypothetical protein
MTGEDRVEAKSDYEFMVAAAKALDTYILKITSDARSTLETLGQTAPAVPLDVREELVGGGSKWLPIRDKDVAWHVYGSIKCDEVDVGVYALLVCPNGVATENT